MAAAASRKRELAFLIACASPNNGAAGGDNTARAAGMDWERLDNLARCHRVRPLLYRRAAAWQVIPRTLEASWREKIRTMALQNVRLTAELIEITRRFSDAGIPLLPHKGPLLAQEAYKDLALREYVDLDLLVRPEDVPQAIALLKSAGYTPPQKVSWMSAASLVRWTGEMSYRSVQGISVDLHWRLTPSHYTVQLDPEMLWKSAVTAFIAGSSLPTLSPEALILVLAVHGGKHCWETLGWVADIAWLIHGNPDFGWQQALDLAQAARCERPLLLVLALTQQVFETKLPQFIVDRIARDDAVLPLAERVLVRWYDGTLDSPDSRELLAFAAGLTPYPGRTLRHVAGLLLHPTQDEWGSYKLPESLFWLYTPGRVLKLARKYLGPGPSAPKGGEFA